MRKLILTLATVACAASLLASTVVLYNPQSPGVTNRVVAVITSADTPQFSGLTNVLINPTLPGSGTASDWKVSGGAVVALTGGDLTAIATANAAAALVQQQLSERRSKTNSLTSVDALDQNGRLTRALAEVLMDYFNTTVNPQIKMARTNTTAFQSATNRTAVPMNDLTLTQLKNSITTKLNAQADNN